MKNNRTVLNRTQKIEKLHWHIQHWTSDLQFMKDEVTFIERLLTSDIFEPNIPNMFERIQEYLAKLNNLKTRKVNLKQLILKHQNLLSSVMESDDDRVVADFYFRHDDLEMELLDFTDSFKNLKAEIFNYVGGTLKT